MADATAPPGKVLARGDSNSATEFDLLGWPEDESRFRLDYRRFAYAGKFVAAATGRMVLHDPDDSLPPLDDDRPTPTGGPDSLPPLIENVIVAVVFSEDRVDPTALWFRYVTIRRDRRGGGLGPDLLRWTCDATDRSYETVRIAANNPFAYETCHKAGFGFTGREAGVAELILERPADAPAAVPRETCQSDLDRCRARDLGDPEQTLLTTREGVEPPEVDAGHSDG